MLLYWASVNRRPSGVHSGAGSALQRDFVIADGPQGSDHWALPITRLRLMRFSPCRLSKLSGNQELDKLSFKGDGQRAETMSHNGRSEIAQNRQAQSRSDVEGEMAKAANSINRRFVLKAGTALAAAGPALLRGGHVEAQPRANATTALFAYVGAFTTPERKGHGGGINVYRVNPTSARQLAADSDPAVDSGELHRQQYRCRDRRGTIRPGRLRIEPRTRQYRDFILPKLGKNLRDPIITEVNPWEFTTCGYSWLPDSF
jgi:hypothetical protein